MKMASHPPKLFELDTAHLSLSGPEGNSFLQGMVTADVEKMEPLQSLLSACCNPKGRVISVFRILKFSENEFLLSCPKEQEPILYSTLNKYARLSRVDFSTLNGQWKTIGIIGALPEELGTPADSLPINAFSRLGSGYLLHLPGTAERFELGGPIDNIHALIQKNFSSSDLSPDEIWRLEDIRTAIPRLSTSTAETYLPQMLHLQKNEGVSFTKGCYIGQEVVARLEHRGQLKRKMVQAEIQAGEIPSPGTPVINSKENQVGEVLYAAPSSDSTIELLTVLRTDHLQDDSGLHLQEADSRKLRLQQSTNPG